MDSEEPTDDTPPVVLFILGGAMVVAGVSRILSDMAVMMRGVDPLALVALAGDVALLWIAEKSRRKWVRRPEACTCDHPFHSRWATIPRRRSVSRSGAVELLREKRSQL
ncbi:hypothetical protein [Microbacterium sp. NPDC056569]|uniref:hypothetical protein n=1 Tax=Microbacterium sp. NPDC056569 TaxID=3345867 RepID=UPI003670A9F0